MTARGVMVSTKIAKAGAILAAAAVATSCAVYSPAPRSLPQAVQAFDAQRLPSHPAGDWEAADLLRIALDHTPRAQAAAADYRAAKAAAQVAGLPPGAGLTLSSEYSRQADAGSPWLYGLALDLPVEGQVRRGARLTAAGLAARQAVYDYAEALWSIRADLTAARIQALAYRTEAGLAREAADLQQARARLAAQRLAAGEDDQALLLAARRDAAAAGRRALEVQGLAEQAQADLARALGLPLAEAAGITVRPGSGPPGTLNLQAWRRDAALSRGDMLKAVADYDRAEAALQLEVARQYPEIRVGPGYSWDHGVVKLPLSLSLALPPPDLNRGAIGKAEADRAVAARALESRVAEILSEVDQAEAELARTRFDAARARAQSEPAARQAADLARRLTVAGEGDRLEEIAAQAAHLEAKIEVIETGRLAELAAARLETALRRPFDPGEMDVMQDRLRRGTPP